MPSGISFDTSPSEFLLGNPSATPDDSETLTWSSNKSVVDITNNSGAIDVTSINYSTNQLTIKSKPTGIVSPSGLFPAVLSLTVKSSDDVTGDFSITGQIQQQQKWGLLDDTDTHGDGWSSDILAEISSKFSANLQNSSDPTFTAGQQATCALTATDKWTSWGLAANIKAAVTGAINATNDLASANADFGFDYNASLTKTWNTNQLILSNLQLSGGVSGNYATGDTRSLISPYVQVQSTFLDTSFFDVNLNVGGTLRSQWNGNTVDNVAYLTVKVRFHRP